MSASLDAIDKHITFEIHRTEAKQNLPALHRGRHLKGTAIPHCLVLVLNIHTAQLALIAERHCDSVLKVLSRQIPAF